MSGMVTFPLNDTMPTIRRVLLADPALAARCTGGDVLPAARASEVRIYGETLPLPPIVDGQMPKVLPPTIVVASAGGGGRDELPLVAFVRVELRAYDTTRALARDLFYAAVRPLLARHHWDDAAGVWLCGYAAPMPILDAELGSDFLVARAMVGFTALYHDSA